MKRISILLIGLLLYLPIYAQKAPEDSLTKAIKRNMHTVQLAVEDYACRHNGVYPTKVAEFWTEFPNIKNPVDPELAVVVDDFSNNPGQVIFKKLETGYEIIGNDAQGNILKLKLFGGSKPQNNGFKKTLDKKSNTKNNSREKIIPERTKEVQAYLDSVRQKARKQLPEMIKKTEDRIKDHTLEMAENPTIADLGFTKDKRAVPVLCKIIESYDEVSAQKDAIMALRAIGERSATVTLQNALDNNNRVIRLFAASVIVSWGQYDKLKILEIFKNAAMQEDSTGWNNDIWATEEIKYGFIAKYDSVKARQEKQKSIKMCKDHFVKSLLDTIYIHFNTDITETARIVSKRGKYQIFRNQADKYLSFDRK